MPIPFSPRLLLVVVPLVLAGAPAPAGVRAASCSLPIASSDPELRASFARFDRQQSAIAARACALFLNTVPAA